MHEAMWICEKQSKSLHENLHEKLPAKFHEKMYENLHEQLYEKLQENVHEKLHEAMYFETNTYALFLQWAWWRYYLSRINSVYEQEERNL